MAKPSNFYPVILAGGSGTRFWPRSRKARAKQVLALNGPDTMIQQTVSRLAPLSSADQFWVITNDILAKTIRKQLPRIKKVQIIAEPVARNTAPAIGLAAFILARVDPKAVIGMFPADHVIGDEKMFRKALQTGIALAAAGENIVVMGIPASRAETGYGYIESGEDAGGLMSRVHRFTEKPNLEKATEFVSAGNFYWNSGIFLWSARTLVNALREHLSETAPHLEKIAAAYGTRRFKSVFANLYPKCENISIDYAVLEPRSAKGEKSSNIFCIRAEFGWNDLGSWAALYEHQNAGRRSRSKVQINAPNVIESNGNYIDRSEGNYIYVPGKFVAAIGVKGLVVVETADALLITTHKHSQDVGNVVKHLKENNLKKLL